MFSSRLQDKTVLICNTLRALASLAGAQRCAALLLMMGTGAHAGEAPDLAQLLSGHPPAAQLWLLGEVHDNAQQHALRLRAFEALLATGARPALLMEQLDRERQSLIDRLRTDAGPRPPDAQRVIDVAAPSKASWQWDFYRPFIALALKHELPIVAANVSRHDARLVASQGLAAQGFDANVPEDILRTQTNLIVASHCGMIDAAQALRMAYAQVARDQFMAKMLEQHRERGAVLLAGNGHVRRDIGVPRWLSADTRQHTQAIGLLEAGDHNAQAFDTALSTPSQQRQDPCASMPRPAAPPPLAASR